MGTTSRRLLVPAFVGLICLLACSVVAMCLALPIGAPQWTWWGALALFAATLLSEAGRVELSHAASDGEDGGRYVVSVATIPHIASALLLPPAMAAALAGIAMLVDEVRGRSPLPRLLFNVAGTVLSVGAAAVEANLLGIAGDRLGDEQWWKVLGFFGVVLTYYLFNTLPVVAITAMASGGSFIRLLARNLRNSAQAELAVALIGGLAAHEWVRGPAWVLVGLSPAIISHLALQSISARNRKAEQIESLDRLGRALSAAFTVEEVFRAAAEHLCSSGPITGCFVELIDPAVHLADGAAAGPAARQTASDLAERVANAGHAITLRGRSASPGQAVSEDATWLVLPLISDATSGGCFGILADRVDAFERGDSAYYSLVAERIAVALENARRAAELVRMAFHDALTGLANRALLLDRLEQALHRAQRYGRSVAVLFVDLDNFKLVNDSLGHEAGDLLLQSVAKRLTGAVRAEDTLARFGGDEFVVLLEEPGSTADALAAADHLAAALLAPIDVEGRAMVVEASIGVAISGDGHERPADLLRDADLALYRAKSSGKGRSAVFEPGLATAAMQRLEMENDLRSALDRQEFRLYYQPIIELESAELVGWEALLRWQHPVQGLVAPTDFIPIAEETGLIVPIGQWVLEEACRQTLLWRAPSGARPLTMSVNLSGRQFQQASLAADVRRTLETVGLEPHVLKLEITESIVMQDVAAATATLAELAGLGVRIAIDDFGTGYSSLAYLKRFPIDTLKIDRSFINGIVEDAQDAAIVRSVIALAKALNLTVTAEGIETAGQQARLEELGCDLGQGYLFGRPEPASAPSAQRGAHRELRCAA